ncbi:MAG: response regulator transcription factor, partial [Coriobacteriales bacterium]
MPKVFVVEDDERLQEELCKLLELEGFEWLVCTGFEDVAGQILAAAPDCVVMDAMIPGGDGRMVCRALRRSSDIPVIMLTCLDSEFDQVTAMDLGADAYLTKPYRPA